MDKQTLTILDRIYAQYWSFSDRTPERHEMWGTTDSKIFYELRNVYFSILTGEPDFDKFYDRFDSPCSDNGKPIAWGPRFWPDMISDEILDCNKKTLQARIKEIQRLYKKCLKLEKNYKK